MEWKIIFFDDMFSKNNSKIDDRTCNLHNLHQESWLLVNGEFYQVTKLCIAKLLNVTQARMSLRMRKKKHEW